MPDVFEFLRSHYLEPATRQFLRAYFGYDPLKREQMQRKTSEYLAGNDIPQVPFDRLPLAVQNALFRDSGFKTFEEFIDDRKQRERNKLAKMN